MLFRTSPQYLLPVLPCRRLLAGSLVGVALLLSPWASSATTSTEATTLQICVESQAYPPYFMQAESNFSEPHPGVVPQLVSQAAIATGLTPQYVRHPWKRCLKLLELNKVDAILAAIFQQDRQKIGRFPMFAGNEDPSRRLATADYAIFSNKGKPLHWDGHFDSTANPSIGAPLGYVVVRTLKQQHQIETSTNVSPAEGLHAVAKGRLDGYIVEKNTGNSLLKTHRLESAVHPLEPIFERDYLHMMISHQFYQQHPQQAELLWDHIGEQRVKHFDRLVLQYLDRIESNPTAAVQ
ncbi:MAG: transporter substrate-binding domain-containing protein [Motiliproteus sp.]